MSDLRHGVDTVLDLTRSLLRLAEEGKWPEIAEVERRRKEMLDHLFRADISDPADRKRVADAVETVLALDGKTVAFIQRERDWASGELRKLQLGQHGRNAYLAVRDEHLDE